MLPAFAEAVRATTQPCTLLLLIPQLSMAVITKGRWAPFAAICVGAVLGGWLFIANVMALSSAQLRLSGVLVAVTIGLVAAAPSVPQLAGFAGPGAETGAAGGVAFVATLWWRPCVGVELGAILSGARAGLVGQLGGITAYMFGALIPVLAAALVIRAIDPSDDNTRRASWLAGGIGIATATALAVGRHDELVTALTRWSTS